MRCDCPRNGGLKIDQARRLRGLEKDNARLKRLLADAELDDAMMAYGPPQYIRSENGPEFVAEALRDWFEQIGVQTLFIEPGSQWENGDTESFNGKLRDELL